MISAEVIKGIEDEEKNDELVDEDQWTDPMAEYKNWKIVTQGNLIVQRIN